MAFTLLYLNELCGPCFLLMVILTSGQEQHMPCLCVGWTPVQKARASGGFSLAFSHQPGLAEVPGLPPVSGMCCGAHFTQRVSSKGYRSADAVLLVFLDPTCAKYFAVRILR